MRTNRDDSVEQDARRAAYVYGLRAELIASFWLRTRFYQILERNYRAHGGEIDVVAKRGRTVAFVEVKARGDLDSALIAITLQKQRRFSRAAQRWLVSNPWAVSHTLRADAIYIAPRRLPEHVENAFELRMD